MKSLQIIEKITNRATSETFNKYLSEVKKIKPFENAEDEFECALKMVNGDESAKEELINRNLRFVISVAKNYEMYGASLADLINEGNTGLVIAANTFEPNKGFKFISYAVWYIRKEMIEYLNNNSRLIRLPVNKINKIQKLKKSISKIEQENERDVFDIDLVDLGLTQKDVSELMDIDNRTVSSLSNPMGDSSDSGTLIDVIPNETIKSTDYLLGIDDKKNMLDRLLSTLTYQESYVIKELYGILDNKPKTLSEVGLKIDLSQEAVRQIRNKAIRKLNIKTKRSGLSLSDMI